MTLEDVQAHAGHGVTRLVVPPASADVCEQRKQISAFPAAHNLPPSKARPRGTYPPFGWAGARRRSLSERAGRADLGVCSAREVPGPGALCLDHLRGSIVPG